MNKNVTKGLVVGAMITAVLLWQYFKNKNAGLEAQYNEQLNLLQQDNSGSDSAKKNEEFAPLNSECVMLSDFKDTLNILGGKDVFDNSTVYDLNEKQQLDPVLEGTTHFFDENNSLRKAFIYDINKTGANALGADIAPRLFNYQYTAGVITLGDKGKDVTILQELISRILQAVQYSGTIDVNGTYDKETLAHVQSLFAGTFALIDETKGTISKEFVNNFTTIISNLKIN